MTGPDTSWAPSSSIGDLAGSYRARVQIADVLGCEANVAGSNYAEQLVAFTYAPGGGVTDPTGLTGNRRRRV